MAVQQCQRVIDRINQSPLTSLYLSPEITKRALELKQDLDRKVVELEANAGTPETESAGMVQATMIAFDGTEVSVATKVPPRKYRTGPYLSFRSTEEVLSMAWGHPEIGTPILVGVSYWDESNSKGEFSIGFARAKAEFEEATRHWVDDGYRKELVELFARPEIKIPPASPNWLHSDCASSAWRVAPARSKPHGMRIAGTQPSSTWLSKKSETCCNNI
jgi:hypothetical protein